MFRIRPLSGLPKMKLLKNDRGATAVEFALVALPVLLFMIGIMQTGYIVWAHNLLNLSVNTAARCGAVHSATPPCHYTNMGILTDMITAAQLVFQPMTGATFTNNTSCSANTEAGLIGTYTVKFLAVTLTLTAQSCYPTVSS